MKCEVLTTGDLATIVGHVRANSVLVLDDAALLVRLLRGLSLTVDVPHVEDAHLLVTNDASVLCGFLKVKYAAIAKSLAQEKKKDYARALTDARNELTTGGIKVTESAVSQLGDLDEQYNALCAKVTQAEELYGLFQELREALRERQEVLIEITRNDRAALKADG